MFNFLVIGSGIKREGKERDSKVQKPTKYIIYNYKILIFFTQRWRSVECKILLEFSGTIATLPDKECPGKSNPREILAGKSELSRKYYHTVFSSIIQ